MHPRSNLRQSRHREAVILATAGAVLVALMIADPASAAEGSGPDGGVRKAATLAGYVSYGLMALTVVWGVLTTTGLAKRAVRRQSLYMSHMALAIATLSFGVIHAITYVFQTQEKFTYVKAFIPFAQGGEIEVAVGIVGLELMAALMATIVIQRRIGYRTWHTLHYGLYGAFALAALHTYATGKEAQTVGLIGLTVAAALLVVLVMTVMRFLPATSAVRGRIATVEP
jgi:sulfoxide reductase heme-binding subunit YedZ